MTHPPSTDRIQKDVLLVVFLTVFLDLVGFGLFIPMLPLVARNFGASDSSSIAISSIYSIGTLLSVAALGRLSDRIGRKKLILGAVAVSAVSQLLTGLAQSYGLLLIVRFIAGMASGNFAIAQACIADVTTPRDRARSMTIVSIGLGLGFSLGPSLGALISLFFPSQSLYAVGLIACLLNVLNLIIVAKKLPETHPRYCGEQIKRLLGEQAISKAHENPPLHSWRQDIQLLLREKPMRIVLLLNFLQVFAFIGIEATLPFILNDAFDIKEPQQQYMTFMYLGVMLVAINIILARPLVQKFGEVRTLNLSQLCLITVMLGLVWVAPSLIGLYFFLSFLAAGTGFYSASIGSLVSRLAPDHMQGFSLGTTQTLAALARITGPLMFGLLYQWCHGHRSLLVSATLMFVCFLITVVGLQGVHQRFANVHRSS